MYTKDYVFNLNIIGVISSRRSIPDASNSMSKFIFEVYMKIIRIKYKQLIEI